MSVMVKAPVSSLIDLWSSYATTIQLTTVAGNKALPSITIAGIPDNARIHRAEMFIKPRVVENTNAAPNALSGAQNIQAKMAVGGAWVTGMAFGGGEFAVPATTRDIADVMMGNADIAAQIPGNGGVVNFQWTLALAAQDNLNFIDVQTGIRIFYTV